MVRVSFRFTSSHFQFLSSIQPFLLFFTSLHGLQDVENHCTHLSDTSGGLVEKFHILIYNSLYNWIGEHEITKLKKIICFESRKKDTKTSTKGHE